MATEVGSAYLLIVPSFQGLTAALQKEFAGLNLGKIGEQVGKELAAPLTESVDAGLGGAAKSVKSAAKQIGEQFKPVGEALSEAFELKPIFSKVRTQAKQLTGQLTAPFAAFASSAQQRLTTVRTAFGTLKDSAVSSVQQLASKAGAQAKQLGTQMTAPFAGVASSIQQHLAPVTSAVRTAFGNLRGMAAPGAQQLTTTLTGAFTSIVQGAGQAAAQVAKVLGDGLRNAAAAGVAALAALSTVSIGAGFSRLTAIDEARAKLTGLGEDGQAVAQIMDNATAAVKGTAFGLDEAATVAAGAIAAQIKPGQELEAHLKNVANNAAAAGVSMGEMGAIFNRAATQANGVQNDILAQLSDRGIPIYAELGKQLGVTAGDVFALASAGKISFEQFSQAATAAAGTVADEMGNTVPGAFKNLRASISRIGANLFGGIGDDGKMDGLYAKFGPLLAALAKAFGPVEAAAARLGAALTGTLGPVFDKVTAWLNQIGAGAGTLSGSFSGIASVIAPVAAALGALGVGGLAPLLAKIPILGGLLGGLGSKFALLGGPIGIAAAAILAFAASGANAEALVGTITGMVNGIVAALPGMIQAGTQIVLGLVNGIVQALPAIVQAAVGLVTALAGGLVQAIPALVGGAAQLMSGLVQGIVGAVPLVLEGLMAVIQQLVPQLVALLPAMVQMAIQLVTMLVQGIVQAIPMLIQGAVTLVQGLVSGLVQNLPLLVQGAVQLMQGLVQALVQNLPLLITAAVGLVTGLVTGLIENLPLLIDAAIQLVTGLAQGLIESLPALIQGAIQLVTGLVTGLIENLPMLIQAGLQLVVGLAVGLVQAVPQLIAAIPQLIVAIWNAITQTDWLSLGVNIITGIINGVVSMAGALWDAVVDIAQSAFDGVKSFFGIASPSRLMRDKVGTQITAGMAVGIEQGADAAVVAAKSASSRVASAVNVGSAVARMNPGVSGNAQPGGVTLQQNIYTQPGMSEQTVGVIAGSKMQSMFAGVS